MALAVVAVGLALSHRHRLPLLAGTATTIAALALVPSIRERAALELHYGARELSGRVRLRSASLDMARQHPVFGTGLGGFVYAMSAKLPTFQIKPIYPQTCSSTSGQKPGCWACSRSFPSWSRPSS